MTPTTKEERDYWKADMNRAFSAGGHRVVPYTHTERLIADVNRLEAENAGLVQLLKSIEWKAHTLDHDETWIPQCPRCYGIEPGPYGPDAQRYIDNHYGGRTGHNEGCKLANAIDKKEPTP